MSYSSFDEEGVSMGRSDEVRPDKYRPKEDQEINIITISDFHHKPLEIREKLKRGEDFIVTWNKRALCFLRHLTPEERARWEEARELPPGVDGIMGLFSLRGGSREDFIDDIGEGKTFIFTIYKRPMGLASKYMPKRAKEMYEEWYEEAKARESEVKIEAAKKRK